MSNRAVEVTINETLSAAGIATRVEFIDESGWQRRYKRRYNGSPSIQRLARVLNRDCVVEIDASPETLYKWGNIGFVARRKVQS